MKLRTKFQDEDFELGEVVDASIMYGYDDKIEVCCTEKMKHRKYSSIKDFTDHWEDAPEEPKKYYYIEITGDGLRIYNTEDTGSIGDTASKTIGNYFDSREETERAVEKLKAFKRLKDKGFRFGGLDFSHRAIKFKVPNSFFDGEENIFVGEQSDADLRFLFGGEE